MSASPSPEPVAPPQHGAGTQALMDEVFGASGSELSDSEGESESGPAVPKRKAFPPRRDAPAADDDDDEDHQPAQGSDDDDDDEEGGDGAYVPGTVNSAAKIPKFKKRAAGDVDMDAEDEEGEEKVRERKKKKKSKHKGEKRRRDADGQDEDEDAPMVDEATQRRLALEARIDAIGKKPKTVRKKKDDEEVGVDNYHDEVCERLRDRMMAAVDKDRKSNENHMPATAKLAMLDEVMAVLRNSTLYTSVVDNGVLDAIRAWLEPMEATAALPAVGIQSALFEVLPKMDLETAILKESRLGPIVLFYTKTKRVTPAISRAADALVQAWSRPIVKRPGDRPRIAEEGEGANRADSQSQSQSQSQGGAGGAGQVRRRRFDAATAIKENHGRKGARMPQVKETQYTVAPVARLVHHEEDTAQVRKIASDNKKFNKFARQMKMNTR